LTNIIDEFAPLIAQPPSSVASKVGEMAVAAHDPDAKPPAKVTWRAAVFESPSTLTVILGAVRALLLTELDVLE
jgi:hypothetical protein